MNCRHYTCYQGITGLGFMNSVLVFQTVPGCNGSNHLLFHYRYSGKGIHIAIQSAWLVLNCKIELLKKQNPPGESIPYVLESFEACQRIVISDNLEVETIKIWIELLHRRHNS